MEYKNQTENRAFQEMLLAAVKRLQNRSGEDLAAKSGAAFHSSRNVLEVLSFDETIEIQLPEFRINSNMDEWHYLTLLHYLDMADGTEGSQKLITFGNLKDGLIRGTPGLTGLQSRNWKSFCRIKILRKFRKHVQVWVQNS